MPNSQKRFGFLPLPQANILTTELLETGMKKIISIFSKLFFQWALRALKPSKELGLKKYQTTYFQDENKGPPLSLCFFSLNLKIFFNI